MRKFRHLSSGAVIPEEPESNKKPNIPKEKPNKKNGKESTGRSHDMNSMDFHHELEPVEDELIDWINQNKGKSLMTDMVGQPGIPQSDQPQLGAPPGVPPGVQPGVQQSQAKPNNNKPM